MDSSIGWELYRSFLGVLKEGSLSGAARLLGITQPTVGRHIAALEKMLGVVLFIRSQQGLMASDLALSLQPYAEAMERTAASMERTASSAGSDVGGVIRVSVSEMIGVEVLPPIITKMRRQYPALKVELVLSNEIADLLHREADIAVRMMRPTHQQLVARHVGKIDVGLHAHQDYLTEYGTPRSAAALKAHTLIGYDRLTPFIRAASKAFNNFDRKSFSLLTDSDLAQLALIRSGAGIGACQVPLARRDPNLVRLLPKAYALQMDVWVTMHEDLRNNPRCRAAFNALAEGLLNYTE